MSDSASAAKREFFNWVASLDGETLVGYEKKLLNILVTNFDELYVLGKSGGQRAKRLAQIIESTGFSQGEDIPENVRLSGDASSLIKTIYEMKIGPFRGFNTEETFEFDKKYTFIYGPNGSGKSSFCEGLEYGLLGEIEESQVKRIGIANYIKNAQSGIGHRPIIYGIKSDNTKCEVTVNTSAYRFSFIEKNRIDAFARISATTPKDQLSRISSLFGLDTFNDFVNGFTDEFDGRYIKLENIKQKEFDEETRKQEVSKNRLREIEEMITKIPEEVKPLIEDIGDDQIIDLNMLIKYLSGEDGSSGVIGELQQAKAEKIMLDLDIKPINRLKETYGKLVEDMSELHRLREKFAALSSEVNYKDLYNAISLISIDDTADKSKCPACKTPISEVQVNPFENAKVELKKMERLGVLQDDISKLCRGISSLVRKINLEIIQSNALKITVADNSSHFIQLTEFDFTDISCIATWKDKLSLELDRITASLPSLTQLTTLIEAYNEELKNKRSRKANVDSQLLKIQIIKNKADNIIARLTMLNEEKVKINESNREFLAQNEGRLQEIKQFQNSIEMNLSYKKAYDSLLQKLRDYRDNLPIKLVNGLNERTLSFYNIINDHDPSFEKFESLQLPIKPNEKIYIKFVGDSRTFDALQILSEGHIKTLGLSLLLAKAVSDDLGFIIFDDIVNAVDDDHRSGIARLLLECPDIKHRQQIITCHGEEFIKKLSHILGASAASKMVKYYKFEPLDNVDERGIVISVGDSKHYLVRAEEACLKNNLKDSLTYCRKAVEILSTQLWRKLGKSFSVNLSVKMRQPNSMPDLASVVDALNSEIKKIALEPESRLNENMKSLKEQFNWALLNKGTHEQENLPEFERNDVKALIILLKEIEQEILTLKVQVSATTDATNLIEEPHTRSGAGTESYAKTKESFVLHDETSSKSEDSLPAGHEKRKSDSKVPEAKVLKELSDLMKNKNEPFDVIRYFEGQGLELTDKRANGGALWVVGGFELNEQMKEVGKKGYRFIYLEKGGRATKHRPAWYCK
ncbi:DNA replication and repair protein RecF [Desulfosporosinus acididurans]|uniref:DNA replication and repair protein RecF n=1 Tax=Desulfosporosinus acididurans TaxID=476652 RepID=A0A0J1FL69_9FIRM|nr:AAA family ATPase [Desulfosporosinus acididurans]KLU63673.1 DNA replication and repair protein RecF [Desulfosporosinus acididurans]